MSSVDKKSLAASFLCDEHAAFLERFGNRKDDYEYVMSEFLRINGVYWSVTALHIMGQEHRVDKNEVLEFVKSCFCPASGGYAPNPRHDPHLLYTLSAVQLAATYDAIDDIIDSDAVVSYVQTLQQPDGSFCGDRWGEVDTRFSFCAVATLALLGRLHDVDVDKATEFIASCMNFDGGFGSKKNSESHAGLIYCCVGFLSIVNRLDCINADLLGWWLSERQLLSGGLNGRPEKLPDVCYSWWVLSSLSILGRLHWIDAEKMCNFILDCQDDETGGIADRPGDLPDPFHTLFGVAGLSMLGAREDCKHLKTVNPVFCMPQDVIDRLKLTPQMISKKETS